MTLPLHGVRAWALLRIARGDTTDDLALDARGYAVALSGLDCQQIAEAAVRGDEATVTAKVPSGLTRENMEQIARDQA